MSREPHTTTPAPKSDRQHVLLPAAAIFLFFLTLFSAPFANRPFTTNGESREAVVVRNMVEQGNFILPLRAGTDIPSKPPLFHWVGAGAAKLFGWGEFAIRFTSAALAAVVLAMLFVVVAPVFTWQVALLAVMILASAFEWARAASLARVDMVFAATANLALLALFVVLRGIRHEGRIRWGGVGSAGVLLALSTLAKGPAGLILPGLAAVVFVGVQYREFLPRSWQRVIGAGGVVLLLAAGLAGVWYLLAYQVGGERFLEVQFFRENLGRLTGGEEYQIGHRKPRLYSVVDLLVGFLPWSLLFPVLWRLRRERAELSSLQRDVVTFSLCWIAVLFLAVTASASKRPVYLIPIYPSLAILLAASVRSIAEGGRQGRLYSIGGWGCKIVGGVLAGVAIVAPLLPAESPLALCRGRGAELCGLILPPLMGAAPGTLIGALPVLTGVLVAGVMLYSAGRSLGQRDEPYAVFHLAGGLLLLIFVLSRFVQPAIARASSPESFLRAAREIVPQGAPVFRYRENMYPVVFYAPFPVPAAWTVEDIAARLAEQGRVFLIAVDNGAAEIVGRFPHAKELLKSSPLAAEKRGSLRLIEVTP